MTQVLDSHPDLAARFALEAEPLLDAVSRRAHRLAFNHAEAEELLQRRYDRLQSYGRFNDTKER